MTRSLLLTDQGNFATTINLLNKNVETVGYSDKPQIKCILLLFFFNKKQYP